MDLHTKECIEANLDYTKEVQNYVNKWPNYCRECSGWGGFYETGCSVPYGSTYVDLPGSTEPCPDCQEEGKCPRCMTDMDVSEEENACPKCGWKWGDEGIPLDPPGCICPIDISEDWL